jgi:octaprenyl-diphosphate synthase
MGTEAPADLVLIYAPIERDLMALDRFLRREFAAREPFIDEILKHIACFGGKQLRPALLFLCTRLVGGRVTDDVVKIAGVLELIHTATLVHDDLLDGAVLRRRVDTVHAKWGERPAILIGDYIYSRAFELSTHVEGMAAVLSRTTHTICEGELLQISCRWQPDISEETYFDIIRKKTAMLHATACELGGVFAGLERSLSAQLGNMGLSLGMAFQVIDDCLDYAGEEGIVGKSLGTDLRQGKPTLPLIYLRDELEAGEAGGALWLREAMRGPIDAATEQRIRERIARSDVVARSFQRAEAFVREAKETLCALDAHLPELWAPARESLELAAGYVLRRQR